MNRFLLVLLISTILFPIKTFGLEKLPGKYELTGDIREAFGKDRVTMIEFFNFSCAHCYKFLDTSEPLAKKFGNKLVHIKVPIYWGRQTPYPSVGFYMAQQKGKEKEAIRTIFDANFKLGANIFDASIVNSILRFELGIEGDVRKRDDLIRKVREGLKSASEFAANETPTIILNNVIKISPRIAGGSIEKMTENLDLIISKLLSSK